MDRDNLNQTCHAVLYGKYNFRAIKLEKTVGWLLFGYTALNTKVRNYSIPEADKKKIQENPLWRREIELAEFQQKRHIQRLEADVQMREGEDGEIRMRDRV